MVVSIKFDADISNYAEEIQEAIKAIRDWETQTGVSSENATEKFEAAIRGVVKLGRATDRTRDDMKQALRGIGLSAGDAEDAIKAIERESGDLGREAPRDMRRAEDAVKDLGDTAEKASRDLETMGDTADTAAEQTEQIGDKAGTVGDGLRSLGQIAKDALEGDFGSAAGGALDALGGLAAAAGVGGAVGSAVVNAISGLVSAGIDELVRLATAAETARDEVVEKMVELGGALDEATIHDRMNEIVNDAEKMANLKILQDATGMSDTTLLRAMAGDSDAAAEALDRLREVADAGTIPDALLLAANKAATEIGGIADAADLAAPRIDLVERAMAEYKTGGADPAAEATEKLRQGMLSLPPHIKPKVSLDTSAARRQLDTLVRTINNTTARIRIGGSGSARQILGG